MKILAFAGSNHRKSINKKLASYIANEIGGFVELLDLNDYEMPIYSIDREVESGVPALAVDFAKKIDESDLLVISLAEYNGTYSSAFKNIFDWVSRIQDRKTFNNKKIFLASTAPGQRGGATVHELAKVVFPYHDGEIVADFILPFFGENFNEETGVVNEEKRKELEDKIKAVKELF